MQLIADDNAKQISTFEEQYVVCRNVICNLVCARALARPEPPNVNRQGLIDKARSDVNKLDGKIAACVAMHMDRLAPVISTQGPAAPDVAQLFD